MGVVEWMRRAVSEPRRVIRGAHMTRCYGDHGVVLLGLGRAHEAGTHIQANLVVPEGGCDVSSVRINQGRVISSVSSVPVDAAC